MKGWFTVRAKIDSWRLSLTMSGFGGKVNLNQSENDPALEFLGKIQVTELDYRHECSWPLLISSWDRIWRVCLESSPGGMWTQGTYNPYCSQDGKTVSMQSWAVRDPGERSVTLWTQLWPIDVPLNSNFWQALRLRFLKPK